MKIYVAFRTDVDPPTRTAEGSFNKLKRRLVDTIGAEYTVATFDIKPDLVSICAAIVDVTTLEADEAAQYKVNERRQLRKVLDHAYPVDTQDRG